MSHPAQQDFIKSVQQVFFEYFINTKVLEVGSLNINGTVRDYFTNPVKYVGCDLGAGPGVDIISRAHELPYEDGTFDVAVSCNCFEHDEYWQQSFQKMYDLLRPDGLLVFSCASTGTPEHGTTRTSPEDAPFTNDYYRNLVKQDFTSAFDLPTMFHNYKFPDEDQNRDLFFWGQKCKK
jgi:SAM-dependent methyltransferase